jgi:hypothetical protein
LTVERADLGIIGERPSPVVPRGTGSVVRPPRSAVKIDPGTRLRKHPRVVFRRMGDHGGAVLLHQDTAAYHGVNETGALIWDNVTDGMTFEELVQAVNGAFEDPPPSLRDDVTEFVTALSERGLLEVVPQQPEETHAADGPPGR